MCDSDTVCEYVARKDEPETWHGDEPAQWTLDQRVDRGGLDATAWACPHPPMTAGGDADAGGTDVGDDEGQLEGDRYCVFHTPPDDRPTDIDERAELLDAIDAAGEGTRTDQPEHRGQFVGATFESVEATDLEFVADENRDIRFDHAVFRGGEDGVSFEGATIRTTGEQPVSFAGATFIAEDGDVSFEGATVRTDGDGDIVFDGARFRAGDDGNVRFDDATLMTAADGTISARNATFTAEAGLSFDGLIVTTDGSGQVWFYDTDFVAKGDAGISFEDTTFSTADEGNVFFHDLTFRATAGPVSFVDSTFAPGSSGIVSFHDTAFATAGNGAVAFDDATFRTEGAGNLSFDEAAFTTTGSGNVRFVRATFETHGEGDLRFNEATFHTEGTANVSFYDATFESDGPGALSFDESVFLVGGKISFSDATFVASDGTDLSFEEATLEASKRLFFDDAEIIAAGGCISFEKTTVTATGPQSVSFDGVDLRADDGDVTFAAARFRADGDGHVSFVDTDVVTDAEGTVTFADSRFAASGTGHVRFDETSWYGRVSFADSIFRSETSFRNQRCDGTTDLSFAGGRMESSFAFTAADWTQGQFDFSGATFRRKPDFLGEPNGRSTEFTNSERTPVFGERVDCRDTTFLAGVDLSDAILPADASFDRADLSSADFVNSDFTGDEDASQASFERADLSGANLSRAVLVGASFEGARLSRAHLLDANLVGTALYGALLGDARINRKTQFWPETETNGWRQLLCSPTEPVLRRSSLQRLKTGARGGTLPYCVYDPRYPHSNEDVASDCAVTSEADAVEKAAETYGTLESVARENSLSRLASQCFLGRKDIQLRKYRREANWQMVCRSIVPSVVARYGESPWRVLGTGTLTVVLCGLAYWAFDLIEQIGGESGSISLFDGLYFSALTFTTLGYGDFRPTTRGGQVLAVAETASGVILLAILVFVFGRRATR